MRLYHNFHENEGTDKKEVNKREKKEIKIGEGKRR